jgi:hypothetical protein
LQQYQEAAKHQLDLARKQMTSSMNINTASLVKVGFDFAKTKVMQGFFDSRLKIDLKLTKEKINLANSLECNLYEALEDASNIPSEKIAAAAAFYLLDALKQNEELVKKSTFGSKGQLETTIKNSLQLIEKYYPEGMKIATREIKKYYDSLALTKA